MSAHDEVAVYLGPKQPQELVDAIQHAGGRLASVDDAVAVVWYGGQPTQLASVCTSATRWVQLPAAGVESFLAAGAVTENTTANVVFTSAAGAFALSVAEHTVALMLAGARRLHELACADTWTSPTPMTLRGATVAIIGAGGIGRALIELLEPFGAHVFAVTRSGRQVTGAAKSVPADELHEVLTEADHVVIAAPATSETKHLIGAEQLAMMKPTSWLINVARGSLVDTDAVVAALRSRSIGGAALDVTDPEPLPDGHPLWDAPNALITPHSANPKNLLLPRLAERVRTNIERFRAGEELVGRIDATREY